MKMDRSGDWLLFLDGDTRSFIVFCPSRKPTFTATAQDYKSQCACRGIRAILAALLMWMPQTVCCSAQQVQPASPQPVCVFGVMDEYLRAFSTDTHHLTLVV